MNLLLSLLSGLCLVLVFPRWDLWWLAPFALAPMLVAMAREQRPARRFVFAYAAGLLYWFGVCNWIQFVLAFHGGMGEAPAWGAFLLFAVLKSVQLGAFGLLAGYVMPRWFAIPASAALWVAVERTHAPLGFAWLALGNAASDMGVPMRLAPVAGVYGVSFVLAMMSAATALLVLRRPRRELLWLAALPLLFLLPPLPPPAAPSASAAVVQPNIDETKEWTADDAARTKERLLLLSQGAAMAPGEPAAALVLWPEVPAPLYYYNDSAFREKVALLARTTGVPLLIGTVAFTGRGQPLNSAVMVNAAGRAVDRYDKINLVPFGEFIPPLFGFVNRITQEAGDFVPGTRLVVFPAPPQQIGAFICYESVFPHFVRRFVGAGAGLLVNLSNDGYFGRSAAREQHLQIVRMRAAENRRWILRATNNGITASIDPAGRVVRRLPSYREAAGRLGFSYLSETTFYTRHGDWFVVLCAVGGAAALWRRRLPRRDKIA